MTSIAYLVGRDKVPDEQENRHHHMLCDGNHVRPRDFEDLDVLFHCSVEVNVVRSNTSSDAELQVLGL